MSLRCKRRVHTDLQRALHYHYRRKMIRFLVGLVDYLLPHVDQNYLSRLVVVAALNSELWEWQGAWNRR